MALALALLAAGGVEVLRARFRQPWLVVALLAFTGADLWYWNMDHNVLTYSRQSYEELYGLPQSRFRTVAESVAHEPLHRIWASSNSPGFGPLNGALDNRLEVTFGYNPLALARYKRYMEAAKGNGKLLDSLAVTAKLNPTNGLFEANPSALPRISVPETVTAAANLEEAARGLPALDPARQAIAEGIPATIPQNGPAQVRITGYSGDSYRASYQAAAPTLLRVAVPYYPGWRAEIDGREQPVLAVDLAMMGIVAPAGSHELVLRYRSNWFLTGALISVCSWAIALALLYLGLIRPLGRPRP
jgi:hypothetical protein